MYPSITKELQSIHSARTYTDITLQELDIILVFRKFVLFYNNTTWENTKTDNFDVTMGLFDFAQFTDLVEIQILDTQGRYLNLKNLGIYRDDG